MKVCYFGTYERNYPRNSIIINGLRKNGVEVIECYANLWKLEQDKTQILKWSLNLIVIPFKLLSSYVIILYKYFTTGGSSCEIIIVGYPGHIDIFLAYILSILGRKHLVFNPLISIYDSLVNDRKLIKKKSILSYLIRFLERAAFTLPEITFLDTLSHIFNRAKIAAAFSSISVLV